MARGEPLIRQWHLLKVLQAHRFGITADELAERFECSKRQVLRDLNILQMVGFPIAFDTRDFGKRFWKLSPNFIEKEELILSMTEMLSLFLSQQLLAPFRQTELGSSLASALEKIRTLLPQKALDYFYSLDDKILAKSLGCQDYSKQEKQIRTINQAITEERIVRVRYYSVRKSAVNETTYHPYGLVFLDGSLYCIGLMETYDEIRTLKLDRIRNVELTDHLFDRPYDFSLKKYLQGSFGIISSDKYQIVVVRFTGWAASMIREKQWHFTQKILEDNDDAILLQFELSDLTEFKRWILSFGRHAIVHQPPELIKAIRKDLQHLRSAYRTSRPCPKQNPHAIVPFTQL